MSDMARDDVLLSLKAYLARAERLHDALRAGGSVDDELRKVFEADEKLQHLAASLVDERAARDAAQQIGETVADSGEVQQGI